MGRRVRILILWLGLCLLIPGGAQMTARAQGGAGAAQGNAGLEYVANIVAIQGSLSVKRVVSPRWLAGRLNMLTYLKDTLKTDAGSVACIEFLNGSKVSINKNTTVEIISSSAARDVTKRPIVSGMILRAGAVWGTITGTGEDNLKIQTQSGVLGIRGTEFVLESNSPEDTKLTVLKGEVEFQSSTGTYSAVPGDVVSFVKGQETSREHKSDLTALRNTLNLNFPGLDPVQQSLISVFTSSLLGAASPGTSAALSQAREAVSFAEDPEAYAQNYAIGQAQSHVPIPIPFGGLFGGGSKPADQPLEKSPENLKPQGETILSYLPEFSWQGFPEAKKYRIIVSLRPLQKGEEDPGYIWSQVTGDESIRYPKEGRLLYPQTTYYWVVVALDDKDKPLGKPSVNAQFSMGSAEELGMRLFYPSGPLQGCPETLSFEWTGVQGCSHYQLSISENPDLSAPLLTRTADSGFLELEDADSILASGKTYYWNVTALNEDGTPLGISSTPAAFGIY